MLLRLRTDLKTRDPQLCHAYFYRPADLPADETRVACATWRAEFFDQVKNKTIALILKNSADELVPYDAELAQQVFAEAGQLLIQELGTDRLDLIGAARKPSDDEEARAACSATGSFMRFILEHEAAVDTLRLMQNLQG